MRVASNLKRTVIIGNSGSGKSFLARKLSDELNVNIIHFDQHFWEPGGFNKKRPTEFVHAEIKKLALNNNWVMEGVFGDLAAIALENATALIFMNKSWDECRSALLERGSESSKQLDPVSAENNFKELLKWAEAYTQRENSRSLRGHKKLFDEFKGFKYELCDRSAVEQFLLGLKVKIT